MSVFRSMVQRGFQACGYEIVRARRTVQRPFDLLELLIRDQLTQRANTDFHFVQVGAHDGMIDDPLRKSVLRHSLRGILVEPLPDVFSRLQTNYANQPGLIFENCAVAEEDGTRKLYRIAPDAPVAPRLRGLASFERRNLSATRQGIAGIDSFVECIEVPALTIRSLLRKHDSPDISLLVVDAEGHDAQVVQGALQQGIRPNVVMYEHVHLPPDVQFACTTALKQHNYRFIEVDMDTYAVLDQ